MKHGTIIFVTGTGTDVGKTALCLLIMRALTGRDAVYLKPLQTGCLDPNLNSDAAYVHAHLPGGLPHGMTPADCIHTCQPLPKAPLYAGGSVDFNGVLRFIIDHAIRHDIVVVEGAGGILVPVTAEKTVLDLAVEARTAILVAGRADLGTINHTLLTLEVIASRGGCCLGTVLLDPTDAVTEQDRGENIQAISNFSGQPVHGVIGHIRDFRNPDPEQLEIINKILSLPRILT